ncbi:MAG: DEAD/DEAH box helicase family protein, partial [Bacillota bacterium]|nr:DEAD/DEAH box helicase family protein [Bacillota bacterium]
MSMDLREKRFESDIEAWLLEQGGYQPGNQAYYLKDKALDFSELLAFFNGTQRKEWERYQRMYEGKADHMLYKRFQEQVEEKGLLSVLRNGIKDRGITLRFVYFAPASGKNQDLVEKYHKNILTCHRQFAYSADNHNTIDMVLSLNGIPIVALELKNQFTGQSVENGKAQYMARDIREPIFQFNKRVLVYFTADLNQVFMTTRLARENTRFLPFNQGSGGAGKVGGSGNPPNDQGYATSYLWEQVLKRDSLLALLQRYISLETEENQPWRKGKVLFPRFHQWDVVEKLAEDVHRRGAGHNYLIQHSAGSGKSNSIAWLAYRLTSLHDMEDNMMFHSVFVVTDRRVLNRQLQETILGFDHQPGLITTITDKDPSTDLRDAILDGKRLIITTLHRFPLIVDQVGAQKGKRFAVIVDEAHSSQSGTAARTLRDTLADTEEALAELAQIEGKAEAELQDPEDKLIQQLLTQGRHSNLSFFGFTATPKPKTLETFGVKQEDGSYHAFHTYSMRQAIDEGFIHDVLRNYTTIENTYAIIKSIPENPELLEPPAVKAIKAFQHGHMDTINKKTAIIVEKFREVTLSKLNGKAKAMVVTASRAHAVKYLLAIRQYIAQHGYEDVKPLVAFSGEITIGTEKYTEPSLNSKPGKPISEAQLQKEFASDRYNLLVVAEKYQTGFSESRLHTMFVDKGLRGVKAVQTLSRLNRVYKGKVDTFVLDFVNTADSIRDSFLPFYEDTFLKEGIDPNMVYTFKDRIEALRLFDKTDVDKFCEIYLKKGPQASGDMGRLSAALQPVILRYNEKET